MLTNKPWHDSRRWLALLFLVVGLLAAGLAWWQGKTLVDREIASQLDARVTSAKNSLQGQINEYTEVLRGYQAQFAAHTLPTEAAFQKTTLALDLESRLPGIQAAGYSPRSAFPETFIIQYIEPLAKNLTGLGYDQASDMKRLLAIHRARDTGQLSTSERLRLFVAPGDIDGLIFILPLYSNGEIPTTQAERTRLFTGFVFLAIRVDEMLRTVFGPELLNDLAITIHNKSAYNSTTASFNAGNLIFDSSSYQPKTAQQGYFLAPELQRELVLPIGGTTWHLGINAQPRFVKLSQTWLPWIAAFVGALLSLLVFLFMRTLNYARLASEARTRKVEQSLHSNEKQLAQVMASINEVLWTFFSPNQGIAYVSPAVEQVYGYPPDAFYKNPRLWFDCIHRQDRQKVIIFGRRLKTNNQAVVRQAVIHYRILRSDGVVRWLRYAVRITRSATSGLVQLNSVGSDVTEEYLLQESLRRSHRALRAIHECNARIAVSHDKNALLQGICEVAVNAGYIMAWVGMLQADGKPIALTNIAGENQQYLDSIKGPLAHEPEQLSTIDSVLHTRLPATANHFSREAHLPWRLAALRYGFRSKAALPLLDGENLLGILNVYAAEENAFDAEELGLLENLAQRVIGALQSLQERDQRKAAEAALYLRQRAIDASANAIVITSATRPGYPIEYVNPAFERMTGYTTQEVIGHSMRLLHRNDSNQAGVAEIRKILSDQCEGHATVRNYRKDGTLFWSKVHIAPVKDDTGSISHFVAAKYDITETKHYQDELESQANHDALTGLANRKLLDTRLRQAIAASASNDSPFWVAFLDLDRFKLINDSLGHRAGDQLLQKISTRLQHVLRADDTLARHGGDEFVLILPTHSSDTSAARVLQMIMEVLAQSLTIDGHSFYTTCSIGIAVYPDDGTDPDTLIKHADIAMYRAKESGRNNFQFFTPALNEKALERLLLEADLRCAIERNEFLLHYQAQVNAQTGKIEGMEALIRWRHPELGMIPPDRFIGIAEDTGLIVPIGNWVIRTACLQAKAWQTAGLANLRVTVNLSARQFTELDLAQSISAILDETGLEPQYLNMELTESLAMANVERSIDTLRQLKQLGLRVSLDDFGTGYSSLSYLTQLPIDILKIDRSFVCDLATHSDGAAVIIAIITLAHSLNLQVIAEGVETEEQFKYLQENGCDQMQGYYFSKPLAATEFQHMLSRLALT
ncbi:EAL domain-containing protein [Alcaligenaceae bacterium]|nr:EAL domain-containing protein [Alcaligenaceae bacterium]